MALFALRELGPERPETHAVFVAALDDPDPEARRAALSGFAKLQEPDRSAAERVLSIVRADPDARMRRIAAAVVPEVVNDHPEVRAEARRLLRELLTSSDPSLGRAARAALDRLPTEGTPPSHRAPTPS